MEGSKRPTEKVLNLENNPNHPQSVPYFLEIHTVH